MLTKPLKGCSKLKSWAMQIAKRAGMKKAKVALARKLAVIMLCMLKNNIHSTTRQSGLKRRRTSFRAALDNTFPKPSPCRDEDQVRPPRELSTHL